tara:strand:+ start:128 stop:385 length:258 start_codon:yes stop_codon:yes gene_type:complete
MSNDDYKNDPAFYLTIAGGCSTLVCCLVCIAKNWDDPPDWLPKQMQPRWKKYFYDQERKDKRNKQNARQNARQESFTLSEGEALV